MEVLRRRASAAVPVPPIAPVLERELPTRVPEELDELDEAIKLLGNQVQALQIGGQLRNASQNRLKGLIGTVPNLAQARAWKIGLKELRRELTELDHRSGAVQ